MKIDFDKEQLLSALEREFGTGGVELGDIPVGCSWPVFSARIPKVGKVFVKIGLKRQISRIYSFLKSAGPCRLLPVPVTSGPLTLGDHLVACLSWQTGKRIDAERMSETQANGFIRGCVEFSGYLQKADDVVKLAEAEESPNKIADIFELYRSRHRFAGGAMDRLSSVVPAVRNLGGFQVGVIHGDFQPRNYGFDGDEMSAVFDFDDLTESLPCADAAYAFVERVRRRELSAADRHRLMENFRIVMKSAPWSRDEWRTAISFYRLRIAARRLLKHMGSPLVALDVWHRDRLLDAFSAEI